jgi:riboflavin synthase
MFSGIVETVQPVLRVQKALSAVTVFIKKPSEFNDLKPGDSIACNGCCLTVEDYNDSEIRFTLAAETLQVFNIQACMQMADVEKQLMLKPWNLERSLRFGDRIHGHLVTGHVESMALVVLSEAQGDSWMMGVKVPERLHQFVWSKGSVTLNGVSLTVNQFCDGVVSVCLIPETQRRTNLTQIPVGEKVCFEPDYFAKAMVNMLATRNAMPRELQELQEKEAQ